MPLLPFDRGGSDLQAPSRLRRLVAGLADRLPLGLRSLRIAPTRAAAAALGAVALLSAAGTVALMLHTRPRQVAVAPAAVPRPAAGGTAAGQGGGSSPATLPAPAPSPGALPGASPGAVLPSPAVSPRPGGPVVVVDVVGAVRRPGVVRLPTGSRVVDAVSAAGGLKPGTPPGAVNLAALLSDGQQIVVGTQPAAGATAGAAGGAPAGGGAGGASSGSSPGGPVDLNTATVEQLDALPGVGPVLAQRILDWRTANGRFSSVDQLSEIGGIGERRLADLRPRVRV